MTGPKELTRKKALGILVTVLCVGLVAGFALGSAGGGEATTGAPTGAPAADAVDWYTCGMHPSVLQKEPGDCPICHMKLTPMKKDAGDGGDEASSGPEERRVLYWRAPMDPGFTSPKPGKSPMGMDLVPVYGDDSAVAGTVRIDPVTIQNMGIRTARIKKAPMARTVRTVGRLDYDERLVTHVNTKFTGWIEKLHVAVTGQKVMKGQALFDVYSPELYVAQEEFLQAVRYQSKLVDEAAKRYAQQNLESARVKLRYYDVTDAQVDALIESGKPAKIMTIYSPSDGVVTEKMAQEGMYVKPGIRLYTIADLTRIWVYVDVYEYQLPWVRLGQAANMTLPYIPGRVFNGKVTYVYPYLQKASRVVKVRLEFDNLELELKPEMYANVRLDAALDEPVLQIPREAYIDSGVRKLAFVTRGKGKFQPREIVTGVESEGGMVQVLHGLSDGDIVVTSGQFLLDAESKLREAVAKMMAARKVAERKKAGGGDADAGEAGHSEHSGDAVSDATFACPMAEHPDAEDASQRGAYFANKAGKCPVCGMKLKPVDELKWVQALKAAGGSEVAYSCPEHPGVLSSQPGTCPRGEHEMEPFKALYTCPDPSHSKLTETRGGECPTCEQGLAMVRGPWLSKALADRNPPEQPPGPTTKPAEATTQTGDYVCPMKSCNHFSDSPGECPTCGMFLKPVGEVSWAKKPKAAAPKVAPAAFTCPMHPEVREPKAGECPVCAMKLVPASSAKASGSVQEQVDYIAEHYLALQHLLAADATVGIAKNALGLAAAAEKLIEGRRGPNSTISAALAEAAETIHRAALGITEEDIAKDRLRFSELSAAFIELLDEQRPSRERWATLSLFRCPMAKADWVQATEALANPYYGFKMRSCGTLQGKK